MTKKSDRSKNLEILQNNRKIIYASLVIAGVVAIIIAISSNSEMTEEEANAPVRAIFYQDVAQCQADMTKQEAEYAVLRKKYDDGQITQYPTAPLIDPSGCDAQMLAAQQEYKQTAPIYTLIADCEAEGVRCEAIPADEHITGYRPVYGGTYIDAAANLDPEDSSYIYYGGYQQRVYSNHTVYQSTTPGRIVTPYGREIAQATTGRVSVPRHTTFAAPSRPTGTSGSGTIRGRSNQGFGSSFKSTGRGGK